MWLFLSFLPGLLAIAKNLDREAVQSIRLQIIARDHGYPQKSSEVYITANIIDVNDNKPKFTQTVYNATIEENQPVGTFVTAVSAVDPDQGKFLGYRCCGSDLWNKTFKYKYIYKHKEYVQNYKIFIRTKI